MPNILLVFLISFLLPFTIHAADINQDLLTVEIEGISLSTPHDTIPEILENHGYSQSTSTTYIKRTQATEHRRSIHRIEISNTDNLQQISYIREKSGGRIKSPPKNKKPILESEIVMAQEIYRLVCMEASAQVQAERFCQPASKYNISFNNGDTLQISSHLEVSLNASATNTAMRLKYSKN